MQQWRGEKYKVDLIPKIKLEVMIKDSELGMIKKTIIENARTGEIGDGKMFISTVDEVVRIRTGEEGEIAYERFSQVKEITKKDYLMSWEPRFDCT